MIQPHGSKELNPLFVYDTEKHASLTREAQSLASLTVSSATAANAPGQEGSLTKTFCTNDVIYQGL